MIATAVVAPRHLAPLLLCACLAACSSDRALNALGDPCREDKDCSSNRCDELRCKAASPVDEGEGCQHSFQCRSENCVFSAEGGRCGPGERADGEPCSDYLQCVSASCVAGICGSAPPSDAGPDGSVAEDASSDVQPRCSCPGAEDECVDSICYREAFVCDLLTPCPAGYSCEDQRCVCRELTSCGVPCERDSDCAPSICGVEKRCHPPLRCHSAWQCPNGRVCGGDDLGGCIEPGPLEDGAFCESGAECQSGHCLTGRCLQPCTRNSDCPPALSCVTSRAATQQLPVCVAESPCDACQLPSDICTGGACVAEGCKRTADCAAGDCYFSPVSRFGNCMTSGPKTCAPDEVLANGPCYVRLVCNNDADCPLGYACDYYLGNSYPPPIACVPISGP